MVDEHGIDHGNSTIEFCIDAMIERCEDGFVFCPLIWSGRTCEDCMELLERRTNVTD